LEVKITVESIVNWVSEDGKSLALKGFGFIYPNVGHTYKKGDQVIISLRLWEKKTEQGGVIKRFYEV